MVASSVGVEAERGPLPLQLSRGPLLPGAYAWLSTVLLPVLAFSGGGLAQALAWGSAGALLMGSLFGSARFAPLRWLGMGLFVAGCLATWVVVADQLRVSPIDATQAALGGIGWMLFAVSVQADAVAPQPQSLTVLPDDEKPIPPSGRVADLLVLLLALLGLVSVYLAWRVDRPAQAVLAQVVAGAAALSALSVAGAAARGFALRRSPAVGRTSLAATWPTFALIALLLVVGLVLKLF